MNKKQNTVTSLREKAQIILFLNEVHKRILPVTTVRFLKRVVNCPHRNLNYQIADLKLAIKMAEHHRDTFTEAIELEELSLEALTAWNSLYEGQAYIHPSKHVAFASFLDELEGLLNEQCRIGNLKAWYKRAMDYLQGIEAKRRQVPMQTQKVA